MGEGEGEGERCHVLDWTELAGTINCFLCLGDDAASAGGVVLKVLPKRGSDKLGIWCLVERTQRFDQSDEVLFVMFCQRLFIERER